MEQRDERQACQTPSSAAFHLLPRMLKMCGASPLLGVANASRSLCCINGIIFLRLRSTPGSDCDEIQALSCQSEALDGCFQKAGLQPHGRGRKINRRTFFEARRPLPAPQALFPAKSLSWEHQSAGTPTDLPTRLLFLPSWQKLCLAMRPVSRPMGTARNLQRPIPRARTGLCPWSSELSRRVRSSPPLRPPPRAGAGGRGSLLLSASQHEPSSPLSAPQGDDSICNCSDLLGKKNVLEL